MLVDGYTNHMKKRWMVGWIDKIYEKNRWMVDGIKKQL